MDTIDALGKRPDRHSAFTGNLLAQAEDPALQQIVEEAARDLGTPIALVTLILEHIQFFRAHYGLPPDLSAAGGSDRDASFCQFVVKEGVPFEVEDAQQDPRVPQHLVKLYGIRAYLGIPVVARDTIVGSLCVIDTEPRRFSEEDREQLKELAVEVSKRLEALSDERRKARAPLVHKAVAPALAELRRSLPPLNDMASGALLATTAVGSFLRMREHLQQGGSSPAAEVERSWSTAQRALEDCEDALYEIGANAGDALDSLAALEEIFLDTRRAQLSEVALAARELARYTARPVGGIFPPDLEHDPPIMAPRSLAVTLVASAISAVAARMAAEDVSGGIRLEVAQHPESVELIIEASSLEPVIFEEIAEALKPHLAQEATATLQASGDSLGIEFLVPGPDQE